MGLNFTPDTILIVMPPTQGGTIDEQFFKRSSYVVNIPDRCNNAKSWRL